MEKPLVSVLTITRNRAKLLHRCIESIRNQTYTNIEHIIVDGASTDNTSEVVSSYHDDRIRFIQLNENLSIHESYRVALNAAKGEFVCLLDDDDEYLPTKIEKQVNLLKLLPDDYGLVVCWMTYYDSQTGEAIRDHQPQVRGYVLENILEKPTISGTPTFLFRMDVYKERFDDRRVSGVASDWVTGAKYCEKWKVDYVPESLVKVYVNHGHTRMTNASSYYSDADKKMITFHNYFLTTYKDIFAKYPERGWYHYQGLVTYYTRQGSYREAWRYYCKLLKYKPSLSNFEIPLRIIVKKILKWK